MDQTRCFETVFLLEMGIWLIAKDELPGGLSSYFHPNHPSFFRVKFQVSMVAYIAAPREDQAR